jgi:uncharacterized membrane protein YuzA (DUF378 family)
MQNEGRIRVSPLDWLSLLLVIVGALNWGLIGLGMFVTGAGAIESWNLVNLLLGWSPVLEAVVYLLVGLAGLYELYFAYQLYAAREARTETTRTT